MKQTCFTNYGVTNSFQSPIVREKYKQNFLKKHGVENPFQSKKIKQKIKNTLIDRYGVSNAAFVNQINYSKISQELFWHIYDQLLPEDQDKCYFAELNKEFEYKDNILNQYFFLDFVITGNKRKVIEFNGNFWHMNPEIYNESDINTVTKLTAKEHWNKDANKYKSCINRGYSVLPIWESDYRKNNQNVINRCLNFLLQ